MSLLQKVLKAIGGRSEWPGTIYFDFIKRQKILRDGISKVLQGIFGLELPERANLAGRQKNKRWLEIKSLLYWLEIN